MTKREILKAITPINRAKNKITKLYLQIIPLERLVREELKKLAKNSCKYKKGQIFKNTKSKIWIKVISIESLSTHTKITEKEISAPFMLYCNRCSARGEIIKNKTMFICGSEIGTTWELVN
jgi:hypothetical protein